MLFVRRTSGVSPSNSRSSAFTRIAGPGGKECVSGFHHEALRMPNGHTMAIAGLERMFPAGTQGSKDPLDIAGDLVIELDETFRWPACGIRSDHMDLNRSPPRAKDNMSAGSLAQTVARRVFLAAAGATEWLHSNALNYIPSSGDFLVSMPAQNWVVKVDWKRKGKRQGSLATWGRRRLHRQSPLTRTSFGLQAASMTLAFILAAIRPCCRYSITVPPRFAKDPKSHSRGQVWKLDERTHSAELLYNADLDGLSFAVGCCQAR